KQLIKRLSRDLKPHCFTQTTALYSITHIGSNLTTFNYQNLFCRSMAVQFNQTQLSDFYIRNQKQSGKN
ncbi:MAG: hypothetical protein VXB09_10020, partial [Gammaproteobacteria bacterium]